MKTLKLSLVVLGAVSLGIGLYMVINLAIHMRSIMGSANAGRSGDQVLASPMTTIWILSGISLLCGLLVGLGIGLPRQTNSRIRKETFEQAAQQRERAIRENALKRAGAEAVAPGVPENIAPIGAEAPAPARAEIVPPSAAAIEPPADKDDEGVGKDTSADVEETKK